MHKHTIHLKQHTPIIHFQHDQHGATLRGSELKPKLDKYIMEKLLRDNQIRLDPNKSIHDQFKTLAKVKGWLKWLVGKGNAEDVALDYKVRIIPITTVQDYSISQPISGDEGANDSASNQKIATKPYPMYFANMGKPQHERHLLKNGRLGNVAVTFTSVNQDLLTLLTQQEWLCDFFFREKFGTRQSKGFGCYYPMNANGRDFPVLPNQNSTVFNFQFDTNKYRAELDDGLNNSRDRNTWIECDSIARMFKALEWFYQSLRNGINYNVAGQKLYLKPAVFQFAKDVYNLPWDKRSVKGLFFSSHLRDQQINHPTSQPLHFYPPRSPLVHWDFKDLLGFSSTESWRSYYANLSKSFSVQYTEKGGLKDSENLTRFKSPLRFHIMDIGNGVFDVWFWMDKIPDNYKNAKVTFECDPRTAQFKMANMWNGDDFLKHFFSVKNSSGKVISTLSNRLDRRYNNAPHGKVLNEIYKNIAKQLNDGK